MVASEANLAVLTVTPRAGLAQNVNRPRKISRVLVVDDHHFVRVGVTTLLDCHDWLKVIGHAADGEEGLRKAKELLPDLVLVDIMLPKCSGLVLAKSLRAELPCSRVVVLSMHPPGSVLDSVIACGAQGYVCKKVATTELIRALETVALGGTYFEAADNRKSPGDGGLSPREQQVLVCIAEGLINKQIADHLGLGIRTVETHRESLMRKLNIRSIAGLTRFALERGLTTSL